MFIDESDALFTGFRCNHHDNSNIITVGNRFDHIQIIIERQIRNDGSTDTAFSTTTEIGFISHMHNGIQITHQYQWYCDFILDGSQLAQQQIECHSVFQCHSTSTLNDRTICQWVTKGHTHFYHIDATTLHGLDDICCIVNIWTACTEIQR